MQAPAPAPAASAPRAVPTAAANAVAARSNLPRSTALLAAMCLAAGAAPALATQRLVPSQYATIQAAIDASANGDEVVLADGTYTGAGNKDLNYGGRLITVRSASGNPALCTIDCENSGGAFIFNHVETSAAVIRGLTIAHSNIPAVRVLSGTPAITNCVFSSCSTGSGSAITINSTQSAAVPVSDCSFVSNHAHLGGAVLVDDGALMLSRCTFVGNSAIDRAGAMYVNTGCEVIAQNCGFFGNHSDDFGGAVYLFQADRTQFINTVFSGNSAQSFGGAIRANDSDVRLVNCTFSGNSTMLAGAAIAPTTATPLITNCILWGNTPDQIDDSTDTPVVTYSDIQGGGFSGGGNVNINPSFVDPNGPDNILGTADDNLRLNPGSSLIDAGNNVPHHYKGDAAAWLRLRPSATTYAFDQFKPGVVNDTGCTTDGDWAPTLNLAGGTLLLTAKGSTGIFYCPITDASTAPAVSDGSLQAPIATLHLDFDPPITAFHTFYGSLAIGKTATMKLFRSGAQIAQYSSSPSGDNVLAIGHGFSSLVPIDRVDITTTDTNTVMGAFVGLASGETSLGSATIRNYSGPGGSSVLKDFGVVFGSADLPGDLDGAVRVKDGDGNGSKIVDMGAYEFHVACPADVVADGMVNVNDLLAVITTWGACPNCPAVHCAGDIAPVVGGVSVGDCQVNVNDLLAVISTWGACP